MALICGRRFDRREIKDPDGCVLPEHHDGAHVFFAPDGRKVEWELDLECDCEDCQSDDVMDWCIIYSYVD